MHEGVLMSEEPSFLEEEGEVLFKVGRSFKGEVVEEEGEFEDSQTENHFPERESALEE